MPRLEASPDAAIEAVNWFETPDRFRPSRHSPREFKNNKLAGKTFQARGECGLDLHSLIPEMQGFPKVKPYPATSFPILGS
jgi:hypothetical protein